jgi:hypothetical protein
MRTRTAKRSNVVTNLEMTFTVKEQILRFDVTMSNTLAVQVGDATQNLLETTFYL